MTRTEKIISKFKEYGHQVQLLFPSGKAVVTDKNGIQWTFPSISKAYKEYFTGEHPRIQIVKKSKL